MYGVSHALDRADCQKSIVWFQLQLSCLSKPDCYTLTVVHFLKGNRLTRYNNGNWRERTAGGGRHTEGWTYLEIMTVTGENVQRVEGDILKVGHI
jgi:hypothetical protein